MVVIIPTPYDPKESSLDIKEQNEIVRRGESWSVSKRRKDFVPQLDIITPDSADVILTTRKFILHSAQEARAEKYQIVQTFGETFLYLFGEQPLVYNYTGTLLDARSPWTDGNTKFTGYIDSYKGRNSSSWITLFELLYDSVFRGSSAAYNRLLVRLQYKDYIRHGVLLSFGKRHISQSNEGVDFSFSMYVTKSLFKSWGSEEQRKRLKEILEHRTERAKIDYGEDAKKELLTKSPPPPGMKGLLKSAANISYSYGGSVYKNDRLDELLFGMVDIDQL